MNIPKHKRLTAEATAALVLAAQAGSIDARNKLMVNNMQLVVRHANRVARTANRPDMLDDMIQVGVCDGLRHAIAKFDPSRGGSFSTYATPWIREAISRVEFGNVGSRGNIEKQRRKAAAKGAADFAMPVCVPIEDAPELSDEADESDAVTLVDGVRGARLLQDRMPDLTPREQEVLTLHHGLAGDKPLNFKEISLRLHVTDRRVNQNYQAALRKLRALMAPTAEAA